MSRVQSHRNTNPKLKILLALGGGGAGNAGFDRAASTATNRQVFARNAVRYLRDNGFDGLDMDWEVPAAEQKVNYTLTLAVSEN